MKMHIHTYPLYFTYNFNKFINPWIYLRTFHGTTTDRIRISGLENQGVNLLLFVHLPIFFGGVPSGLILNLFYEILVEKLFPFKVESKFKKIL